MGGFRDLRRFSLGAVIAPQIILTERLHFLINRDDRRACGIEGDRLHLIAWDAGFFHRLASCGGESNHVIFMRLSRVFRIFAFTMQWIFDDRRVKYSALAVHNRDANAQCSEIYAGNNGHQQFPSLRSCQYISQPKYLVEAS